jgi:hypothetical protein
MTTLLEALRDQRACLCRCHQTLSVADRTRGVEAIYHLDDTLRGWGYRPLYDRTGDKLWREAQKKNDPSYRGVAVRFGECVYKRLVGSLLHEVLHALMGDVTKANYGVLFGLPYGVPEEIPPSQEESFLMKHNFDEARAWVGVWILGRRLFGIDWDLRNARDIGTYGFPGGNALVPVIKGYRPVAHIDRVHHTERYYARGRKLEEEARAWFTPENVEACVKRVEEAAARGRGRRPTRYPDPGEIARVRPRSPKRGEECLCGRPTLWEECCGGAEVSPFEATMSR